MKELSEKHSIFYICLVIFGTLWFGAAYHILNQITPFVMGIVFGLFIYPILRLVGEKLEKVKT